MRQKLILISAVLTLLLLGCQGFVSQYLLKIEPVEQNYSTPLTRDEVIVFGRLALRDTGVNQAPYRRFDEPIMALFHVESERRSSGGKVESNGYFYWRVPRGTYLISSVNYLVQAVPQAAFQVPEGGGAYYLGTLDIDLVHKKTQAGLRFATDKKVIVTDDFDRAKKEFLYRLPSYRGRIEKSLIAVDKRLPTGPERRTKRELSMPLTLMRMPPNIR